MTIRRSSAVGRCQSRSGAIALPELVNRNCPRHRSAARSAHIQIKNTGTSVVNSTSDAIIAKPTASASGMKRSARGACMKNAAINTARMHSIAMKFGTTVSVVPSNAASRSVEPRQVRVDILDDDCPLVEQVVPTASASPPKVIRLMVCPVAHNATAAARIANGMFTTTTTALRQSRRNSNTIKPVRIAPSVPPR